MICNTSLVVYLYTSKKLNGTCLHLCYSITRWAYFQEESTLCNNIIQKGVFNWEWAYFWSFTVYIFEFLPIRMMNHHKQELVCRYSLYSYSYSYSYIVLGINPFLSLCLLWMVCYFTENKHQHHDDDSGMGPSTFTDTKSTNFSEVNCCIDAGSVVRSYIPSLLCTRIVWMKR